MCFSAFLLNLNKFFIIKCYFNLFIKLKLRDLMIHHINRFIASNYPTNLALGGAVVCAIPTIEMAGKALENLRVLRTQDPGIDEGKKALASKNLKINVLGSLFFGFCATNIIPCSAAVGAALFGLYAYKRFQDPDAGQATMMFGTALRVIKILLRPALHIAASKIAHLASKIALCTYNIISAIGKTMKSAITKVAVCVKAFFKYVVLLPLKIGKAVINGIAKSFKAISKIALALTKAISAIAAVALKAIVVASKVVAKILVVAVRYPPVGVAMLVGCIALALL